LVAAFIGKMPPVFPFLHGFTQGATPLSKSAMMLLVTLSYRAAMCMRFLLAAGIREFGCRSARGRTKELRN
jgi:hypothetical protein